MKQVGIIGLGDMGISMAKNIIKSGFELTGFNLRDQRLKMLEELGGHAAGSPQKVGEGADAVFTMVLNGAQVYETVRGEDGLLESMKPGSTIIVSATIHPKEVQELADPILAQGINLIDSPVAGGKSGAESGSLTMMTATKKGVFEANYNGVVSLESIYRPDGGDFEYRLIL